MNFRRRLKSPSQQSSPHSTVSIHAAPPRDVHVHNADMRTSQYISGDVRYCTHFFLRWERQFKRVTTEQNALAGRFRARPWGRSMRRDPANAGSISWRAYCPRDRVLLCSWRVGEPFSPRGGSWARERSLGLPHAIKGELKSRPGDRLWRDEKSLASGGYSVEVHDRVPAADSP